MSIKKHFFINRIWIVTLLIFFLLVMMTVSFFKEDVIIGILWLLLDLVCLFGLVLFPPFFVIDGRGIRIHYFFAKESYLWKNINWVEVRYSPPTRGRCIPYLFDTFTINGKSEEKKRFFMQGEIARSRRARKLIEKYSGKKIEGYFSEDVKAFFEKRKAKKEKTKKQKKHQKRT